MESKYSIGIYPKKDCSWYIIDANIRIREMESLAYPRLPDGCPSSAVGGATVVGHGAAQLGEHTANMCQLAANMGQHKANKGQDRAIEGQARVRIGQLGAHMTKIGST